MEDRNILGNTVKIISQYGVGQNYDVRCTYHPLGKIYNSRQRAEAVQDGGKPEVFQDAV